MTTSGTAAASTASASTASPASSRPGANGATSTVGAAAEGSLSNGRHPAYLTAVDPARRTVTIDVVQFFSGDAAVKAAKEDGGESPPPNDYRIRHASPRTRTFAITSDAKIIVISLAVDETGTATDDIPSTLLRLARYRDLRSAMFWVTIRDGKITALDQPYLP